MKLKVNDTYWKNGNITTNFEPSYPEDVLTKVYLDTESSKVKGHISEIKKD